MSERLLLDMDGVIANTMGSVFDTLHREKGISICHADVDDYWFSGLPVTTSEIFDVMKRDGFYRDLDVITGAVQAVRRLREMYDVTVCSAPLKGHDHADAEKREWLARHFDNDFAESAIITHDKSKVSGKAIIEDNPHVEFNGEVIIFDQAWNRKSLHRHKMFGWHDLRVVQKVMDGIL